MKWVTSLLLLLVVGPLSGCGDDESTRPEPPDRYLVGGGRQASEDSFEAGPVESGPRQPGYQPPDPTCLPLFYLDRDCQEDPSLGVITNQEDWQAWWTAATACWNRSPELPGHGDESPPDSGIVYPDTLNPYPEEAPEVDFMENVVLTIALEPDSALGRSVWIVDVVTGSAGTTVRYQASSLDPDCVDVLGMPVVAGATSPTLAAMAPRPIIEPVVWDREDVVYDCAWQSDPSEPLALYYTDALCELGPGEEVIRDARRWEVWLRTAMECDRTRWYGDSLSVPGGLSPDSLPVPPPSNYGIDVDFTTHAVVLLRADAQERWGGGMWLDEIDVDDTGTTIGYVVMIPGGNCPLAEDGVRPTLAIRVPLPLDEPVTWNRRTEIIDCDWRDVPETLPGGYQR